MLSSRKFILFFTGLLLAMFSAMLFTANPALAVVPIGFSVIFMSILAVAFFLDWLLSKATAAHRLAMVPITLIVMVISFTAMNAPGWMALSVLLTSVGFAVSARSDRRRRAADAHKRPAPPMRTPPAPSDIETAARAAA